MRAVALREAQALATLLQATTVALAIASVAWLGADYPLVTLRNGTVHLNAAEAGLIFSAMAVLYSLVYKRLSRVRRWRRNLVHAGGGLATSWVGTLLLVLSKQVFALAAAAGQDVDERRCFAVVVGLLLLWRANLMPKSRPGWFNGVALPVFAPDALRWRIVHRYAAIRLVIIGLVGITLAFSTTPGTDVVNIFVALLIAELVIANGHALLLGER